MFYEKSCFRGARGGDSGRADARRPGPEDRPGPRDDAGQPAPMAPAAPNREGRDDNQGNWCSRMTQEQRSGWRPGLYPAFFCAFCAGRLWRGYGWPQSGRVISGSGIPDDGGGRCSSPELEGKERAPINLSWPTGMTGDRRPPGRLPRQGRCPYRVPPEPNPKNRKALTGTPSPPIISFAMEIFKVFQGSAGRLRPTSELLRVEG